MASVTPYFFEEGQEYEFTVISRQSMPPGDDTYFVMASPFQTRHLLAEKHYIHYKIIPGQKIKCSIDKINCSGKIYLEPRHPAYEVGQEYDFPVKGVREIVNSAGAGELMLVLEDCFKNEVYVNISGRVFAASETVRCRVDRIKKGKLYLTPVDFSRNIPVYETGKYYQFILEGIVTLAEGDEYYVLRDEQGNAHHLRKKYFEHYGFHAGCIVYAQFLSQLAPFRHYLEPLHPEYKTGGTYEFSFAGIESYINERGTETRKPFVRDGSGKEYAVQCADLEKFDIAVGSRIWCRVSSIRMARLALECL
ncbi:MAG TPA: hypothetical protein PLB59_12495 [Bacteroidales bacterium]|nr:hypothetical protein [Bacteroidales bacterium]HQN17198.1 hypothetical protein [Bacteroidales bacterium]HQP16774.1 hypothetical protein [Bacteroidales bacterium]